MRLIYNKLRNEDQHIFSKLSKENLFHFHKNLLYTYLKPKAHIEKETSKATCILKNLLKTYFYNLKYEYQCTL
jgi:hypothetical protein